MDMGLFTYGINAWTSPGVESYAETEWLMPLQVPIDLYNALKEYMEDAIGLLVDVHTLDPQTSRLLFPYHSLTTHLLRQITEKLTYTVGLLNRLAVQLLDPSEPIQNWIRPATADLCDGIMSAIRKSANEVLYNRETIRSALEAKYGPLSALRYFPWIGFADRMERLHALPAKIQRLLARLDRLQECEEIFQEHIGRMDTQVSHLSTQADEWVDNKKAAERMKMLGSMLPHLTMALMFQEVSIREPDTFYDPETFNDRRWWETPVLVRYDPESHIVQDCS